MEKQSLSTVIVRTLPEPVQHIFVVDAHRPAQRDKCADPIGVRQRVVGEQPRKANIRTLRRQPGGDTTQALERDVLEHLNLLHFRCVSSRAVPASVIMTSSGRRFL